MSCAGGGITIPGARAMTEYGVFHAERARRQALIDRGEDAASIEPWPLDRWHQDGDDEDLFIARGEDGTELCRVEFWYDPREHGDERPPNEAGEQPEAVAEVIFPGDFHQMTGDRRQMIDLYEATPEDWGGLGERDRHIAAWEQRRIHQEHTKHLLEMVGATREKFGEAEFQRMLDDPDPLYDGFRGVAATERDEADKKRRN
jgi:hypothetical protein